VDLQQLGKVLLFVALGLALTGMVLWLLGRAGLGSLPGDIKIQGQSWSCYIPIATSILLSLVLTLLVWLFGRFGR
jgi:ABC-type Na+ efflux pump permease subunit